MLPPLLKLLRPADWVKNVFVLVPAVFWLAGEGKDAPPEEIRAQLARVALAFAAFSLAGSGFYALNDVLDAAEDRKHPTKRHRPVASGAVTPPVAVAAGLALLAGAFAVAAQVGPGLLWCIAVYAGVQVAYNARLKRVRLVDVVTVAIADVSWYVRPASRLDAEAQLRGNSVYFPDRVVPMLPERISNDLCSLREGELRPCLAVEMIFDAKGKKRAQDPREAKLAQALRANLRRRKVPTASQPAQNADKSTTD